MYSLCKKTLFPQIMYKYYSNVTLTVVTVTAMNSSRLPPAPNPHSRIYNFDLKVLKSIVSKAGMEWSWGL